MELLTEIAERGDFGLSNLRTRILEGLRTCSPWTSKIPRESWEGSESERKKSDVFTLRTITDGGERESELKQGGMTPTYYQLEYSVTDTPTIGRVRNPADAARALQDVLVEAVVEKWRRRGLYEFVRLAANKIVAGVSDEPTLFDFQEPAIRLADMVDQLLKSAQALNGVDYTVISELRPRRFKKRDGKLVEISPYVLERGIAVLNAEYEDAKIEESYLFAPSVMTFEVPSDDPENYVGELCWTDIRNNDPSSPDFNPDGSGAFYRAVIKCATRPGALHHGYVIRHLR